MIRIVESATCARGASAEVAKVITIVVIGGQSLCLLITLLLTPVAYSLFDDLGVWLRRVWQTGLFSPIHRGAPTRG